MGRATGIEITETTVRVADVEGAAKKFRVLGAAEIPIAVNDEGVRPQENVEQALRLALKQAKAKREFVILGLPARKAIIREILIPFTDDEQIKKVIKFESESHLPTTNIEDVVVGYHKIGVTGPRSRLLIVAVPKKVLAEYLSILGNIGIDPNQIDLDAAALFSLTRLLPGLDGESDKEAHVILDVGEVTTTVIVATGEHLRMVRCMRMGAESLTRTLSHDLGVDREKARTVTMQLLGAKTSPFATVGETESREPSTAMTSTELQSDIIRDKSDEFGRRVVNEIRRSLGSVQLEAQLAGIWLTGPAAGTPGLEHALSSAFRVSVRDLDVLGVGDHAVAAEAGSFTGPSIGLALKSLDHDPLRFDFRQEEFRFSRKFDRIRLPLIFGAAALFFLLVFLCILEYKQLEYKRMDTRFCADRAVSVFEETITQYAVRDEASATLMGYENEAGARKVLEDLRKLEIGAQVRGTLNALRKSEDALQKGYGVVFGDADGSLPPEQEAKSCLYRLDQFTSVLKKCEARIGWYAIDKLDTSSTGISWTMRTRNLDTFTILTEEFKKLEGYESSIPGAVSSVGNEHTYASCRIEFTREG